MTREKIDKALNRTEYYSYEQIVDFALLMVRRHNEELEKKLESEGTVGTVFAEIIREVKPSCTCSKVIREAKP